MAGNANSGRPSQPAVLKLLNGNRGKQSFGELMEEVKDSGVPIAAPAMPTCLSDEAVAEWERVLPDLMMLGLVSTLDGMILATYCEAVADWQRFRRRIAELNAKADSSDAGDVQTFATGAKQISVWRQLANDAEKRANSAGAQFGFSPMARRNLKTAAPQGELFPNEQRDAANKYFS
ncbi:phage terminase small subunit P27 family [Pseudomonas akapageensis]|uniref:phage terminase small subunit P27 family n=1 Tax=Pseudomonas akapageensis TaxID=2609961 RepID=UPI0014076868|nr:phage terminase small subunit P27 family [Pseudomonas akapageensis]